MTLDRTIAPEIKPLQNFKIPQAKSCKLSNGIPLYLFENKQTKAVKIEITLEAGAWYQPKLGVAELCMKMLTEGTSKYSATEIAEKFANWGTFHEFRQGLDKISLTILTISDFINETVSFICELLQDSIFPEKSFQKLIEISKHSLLVNQEKTSHVATSIYKKKLYGTGNAYGTSLEVKDLEDITIDDLKKYFNSHFKSLKGMKVFVSGGINQSEAISIFEKSFGELPFEAFMPSQLTLSAVETSETYEEKENALQTSLRVGKLIFNRHHPDFLEFTVLNEILGGYFGSRLMKNIREDKGYTYGISSYINVLAHASNFTILTDIKKEARESTLNEIKKEIEILQTELVSEEELKTVKNYMLGSFMGSITSPFEIMDKFKLLENDGLNYDFYDTYYQTIVSITPKRIKELAIKYLDWNSFTKVCVG